MRKLRYHEKKLLKKVDFLSWDVDNHMRELKVLKRFHIQNRDDYTKYNKLSREVRQLAEKIKELDAKDPFRVESTAVLLEKLYNMGLVPTKRSLELVNKICASSFCRRRLSSVMIRLKMAENQRAAVQFIEQGHVRVGVDVVTDPAFLVTRPMEDFVTWTNTSAIRKHVMQYNQIRDDFEIS